MPPAEIDLLTINRGAVAAPAGCGKTQLIADALNAYQGTKPILVLTHTNAGVASLRGRLERAGVPRQRYRLYTIDGWSIRITATFPIRSNLDPTTVQRQQPAQYYPAIRDATLRLLAAGHVSPVIRANYAQLIVDEYQDCSIPQHRIVTHLSQLLPCCVLGDPLQAIFGFPGNALADWHDEVCTQFPLVGQLRTPWRWRNAGAEDLGQWLLQARALLMAGRPVDMRNAPPQVTWIRLEPGNEHTQRHAAAMTVAPTPEGRVLIIGDSTSPAAQQDIASRTPGAVTIEAVDLRDLLAFGRTFDLTSPRALGSLLTFAQSMMTNLEIPEFVRRLDSLSRGTARIAASPAEYSAMGFSQAPSYAGAANLLQLLKSQRNVRAHRPEIMRCAVKALRLAAAGETGFADAAARIREENRHLGRDLPRRAVGSTLLLKGLEAEVAVIMNADILNAANLYVAMTRGSMRLVVCSVSPLLGR